MNSELYTGASARFIVRALGKVRAAFVKLIDTSVLLPVTRSVTLLYSPSAGARRARFRKNSITGGIIERTITIPIIR